MTNTSRAIAITISAILISTTAAAADPTYIYSIVHEKDYIRLQMKTVHTCKTDSYSIKVKDPDARPLLAMLLVALSSNKKVEIGVVNCLNSRGQDPAWGSNIDSVKIVDD